LIEITEEIQFKGMKQKDKRKREEPSCSSSPGGCALRNSGTHRKLLY
jgi:hypothetical protein